MTAFDGNVATNSVDAPQVEVHILNNSSNMVRHRQSRIQNNTKVPDFARLLDNIIANSQAETINFLGIQGRRSNEEFGFLIVKFLLVLAHPSTNVFNTRRKSFHGTCTITVHSGVERHVELNIISIQMISDVMFANDGTNITCIHGKE